VTVLFLKTRAVVHCNGHFQPSKRNTRNLRANLPTPTKLLDRHLQQRLPRERPTGIENRRRTLSPKFLLNLLKGFLDTLLAGNIRANPNSFASRAVDLFNQTFKILRRAGEESDRVCFAKAAGDSGACSGADACYDGEGGGGHGFVCCLGGGWVLVVVEWFGGLISEAKEMEAVTLPYM
jgi:hypothetical protein